MAPTEFSKLVIKLSSALDITDCTSVARLYKLPKAVTGRFNNAQLTPGLTLIQELEQRLIISEDQGIMKEFRDTLNDLQLCDQAKLVSGWLKETFPQAATPVSPAIQDTHPPETKDIKEKIFISFNFSIKVKVTELKEKIESEVGQGSCWICTTGVKPGDILDGEISKAIKKAHVMLCFINQPYIDSKMCEMEFLLARKLKMDIIPIHMENIIKPFKKTNGEDSPMQLSETEELLYAPLYRDNHKEELDRVISKLKDILF